MIILRDTEKSFDKLQYPFVILENPKTLRKLQVEGEILNLIKSINEN